jgi:hypothetical protein
MGRLTIGIANKIGVGRNDDILLSETLLYKKMVEADGGIINDLNYVNNILKFCKNNNINSSGLVGLSTRAGIKITDNKIVKRYNLFSTAHEIQTDTAKQYLYNITDVTLNNKPSANVTNKTSNIAGLVLPTWIDVFLTGNFQAPAGLMMEHGTNVLSVNGNYLHQNYGYTWAVRRTTVDNGGNATVTNWGLDKMIARWIYNDDRAELYKNRNLILSGRNGTLIANSNTTNTLNLFSRNNGAAFSCNGTTADFFIFSKLNKTISDDFEYLLVDSITPKIPYSINILTDGDSLSYAYAGATTDYPTELKTLLMGAKMRILTNDAVPGQNSDDMKINYQAHLDAAYNLSYQKNISIIWIGANDLISGKNENYIYANIINLVNASNAKGFKTYVIHNRPMKPAGYTAGQWDTFWTISQALNILIDNGQIENNYISIPITTNAAFNGLVDADNTTYYLNDKVHSTNLGHKLIAQLCYNTIYPNL